MFFSLLIFIASFFSPYLQQKQKIFPHSGNLWCRFASIARIIFFRCGRKRKFLGNFNPVISATY